MSKQESRSRPRIAVVGSINMDLVVTCERLPQPGETLHGDSIQELSGGKGANQAVAAARLGADVSLIGRVGDDTFGPRLVANLQQEKVGTHFTCVSEESPSGVAVVAVESSGENSITIVAGANGLVSPADVRQAASEIEAADALLLQLEIPVETVLEAITTARKYDTPVMLDPAPAPTTIAEGLLEIDFICPNESEAALLTGLPTETDEQAIAAAARLCEMGTRCVVITRGERGALVYDHDGSHELISSVAVEAVDTTAAGDAFAAAFAVCLSKGASPAAAARFACRAGALAASRLGAQTALPTHEEVES